MNEYTPKQRQWYRDDEIYLVCERGMVKAFCVDEGAILDEKVLTNYPQVGYKVDVEDWETEASEEAVEYVLDRNFKGEEPAVVKVSADDFYEAWDNKPNK